jgi:hypothetical protein
MNKKSKASEIVNILGVPFTVQYVDRLKDTDNSSLSGETDGSQHLIKISKSENATSDRVEMTLLHEIIHAILYISGQSAAIDNNSLEEGIVLALENGLHQLYKRG